MIKKREKKEFIKTPRMNNFPWCIMNKKQLLKEILVLMIISNNIACLTKKMAISVKREQKLKVLTKQKVNKIMIHINNDIMFFILFYYNSYFIKK